MKVRLLRDHILIKRDEPEKLGSGIIEVPDAMKKASTTGIVVQVGPGAYDKRGNVIPMQVQVGDKVHFENHAGKPISDELYMLREAQVMMVERDAQPG